MSSDIDLHDFVQPLGNRYPLVVLHLNLVHLNPRVLALPVIGIPFQGTHLADAKPQTPEVEVHTPQMLRQQMELWKDFAAYFQ